MTLQRRELYRSAPSGDRWSLVREPASERVFIEHEPNASSGGQTTRIEIADFLMHGGHGPEHKKLRYRGLTKNTAQLHTLFALANLVTVKKTLLAQGRV